MTSSEKAKIALEIKEYFLTEDIQTVKVTAENLNHYKHLNAKVGDELIRGNLRGYKALEDLDHLFNTRFHESLEKPETTEQDFIIDELSKVEGWLSWATANDPKNRYTNIMRRYIELLRSKQVQTPKAKTKTSGRKKVTHSTFESLCINEYVANTFFEILIDFKVIDEDFKFTGSTQKGFISTLVIEMKPAGLFKKGASNIELARLLNLKISDLNINSSMFSKTHKGVETTEIDKALTKLKYSKVSKLSNFSNFSNFSEK